MILYLKKLTLIIKTMSKNNTWMIMTYYCPTYGSLDHSEPIEITRYDLSKAKLNFNKSKKSTD